MLTIARGRLGWVGGWVGTCTMGARSSRTVAPHPDRWFLATTGQVRTAVLEKRVSTAFELRAKNSKYVFVERREIS